MTTDQAKAALRRQMKRLLAALPPEAFHDEGLSAAARITGSPLWRGHPTVLAFVSLPGEIDTRPLLESALRDGKALFVPRVEGGVMRFRRVWSPDGPWETGAYGIREPAASAPLLDPAGGPVLVLTPGLAFDRRGARLGRGGGFYDSFLAGLDAAGIAYSALGVCLACQVLPEGTIPVTATDKRVTL